MIAYDAACIILVLDDIESGGNSRLLRSETIGTDRLTWLLVDKFPWCCGFMLMVAGREDV